MNASKFFTKRQPYGSGLTDFEALLVALMLLGATVAMIWLTVLALRG